MKKFLLPFIAVAVFLASASNVFAQTSPSPTVRGKVVDALTNEPLPGASVLIKGTQTAVSTNPVGDFSIKLNSGKAALLITFIGFVQKEIEVSAVSGSKNLGVIALQPTENTMNEVVITSNIAIDRKTPVAVSTVGSVEIEEKASNQEFPELLKSTPGVYATKEGGGYGDSRINMRGFQSANIAVMINGVPVNDMESGRVYWSNWAGLTDVTRSMQVQRGLGASKVAVPSVGGTINIMTKTTDATKGGFVYQGFGNNNYNKTGFSYSSGLNENGWAFSLSGSMTSGDGWAEGLQFEAYNYFFNVSKVINKKHTLSLTGFGAPQYHAQRYDLLNIQTYRNAPQGIKYNPNWAIQNGESKTISGNFYHKPQFSLNHSWTIDETSFLSTAVYASIGNGGNEFDGGAVFENYKTGGFYSPIDLDALVDLNVNSPDGKALAYLQSNRNNHRWYGALSTYQKRLNDKFNLLGGVDLRYYKGIHYNSVRDLLGADYYLDNSNVNSPNNRAKTDDKIGFYNDGIVLWEGLFAQGEYSSGPLSAFVALAASNTSYKRIDYFKYLDSDPMRESDFQNFFGYQVKGGANYNLSDKHNVFVNVGYFEKAPFFNAVFLNNQNVPNADAENEKILSYELGYGFRSTAFSANLNLYRTNWKDRSFTRSFRGQGSGMYFANLLGVDALHQGIELDFKYKPVQAITISGMVSLGDWTWQNDLDGLVIFDENQVKVGEVGRLYMNGIKVGDQPQTTAAIGLDYNVTDELKIGANYNFYGDYVADFDPTSLDQAGLKPWKLPNYSLLDLNASLRFKFAGLNAALFANVNNVFNTEYLADATASFDDETGVSNVQNSRVFYGIGRTWTTGLKVNF